MHLITVMKFVSGALALLALTFLPTIIALCTRKVHWREAFVVNLAFAFTFAGWFAAIAWAATGDDAKIKTRFRALSTRKKILLVLELVFVEVAVTGYAVFHHSSHATHLLH
ncbi:superinfection immunity protein [Gluconobacter kondonii]|uniref:superinfection immunity protein n=2 Tax=Gluconobacter kondonii TaxID=941463 RepID=UPI001B8B4D7D|nr:superinfection immunity protein [Gluconobacter kondonii]MBS1077211.1 superinfection immunity protein [Gluconobacter kondonii]